MLGDVRYLSLNRSLPTIWCLLFWDSARFIRLFRSPARSLVPLARPCELACPWCKAYVEKEFAKRISRSKKRCKFHEEIPNITISKPSTYLLHFTELRRQHQELFRLCRSFRTLNGWASQLRCATSIQLGIHTSMHVTNSSRSIGEEKTKFIRLKTRTKNLPPKHTQKDNHCN